MTDRSDDDVAARLATEAGNLLLGVREELAASGAAERKAAGDKLRDCAASLSGVSMSGLSSACGDAGCGVPD